MAYLCFPTNLPWCYVCDLAEWPSTSTSFLVTRSITTKSVDMEEWYHVIVSGSVVATNLSEIVSRVRVMLLRVKPTPRKVREVTFLLGQLGNALQSFSKALTTTEYSHTGSRQVVSTLKTTTEQMHIFEHVLLYHEEETRNLIDDLTNNPITAMVRFKLFGENSIHEFQMAVQRIKSHILSGCAYVNMNTMERSIQFKQTSHHEDQDTTQAKQPSRPSPTAMGGLSEPPPFAPCELSTQTCSTRLSGSDQIVAELEGSSVPVWTPKNEATSSASSDYEQKPVPASPEDISGSGRQNAGCDELGPRSATIKSHPDQCSWTCRPGRQQTSSSTCGLQKPPHSVVCASTPANVSFSIGPAGWTDPITSYCSSISKQFVCELCGSYSDCQYANYRACVRNSSRCQWYLECRFGRVLVHLGLPVEVFKAVCVIPTARSETPTVILYLFTDCLVLAYYATSPSMPLLEHSNDVDTIPMHVQPFARIHFSSIACLNSMRKKKRILIVTKPTASSETISASLTFGNSDDQAFVARTITAWLQLRT